jgi:hypothetical protein
VSGEWSGPSVPKASWRYIYLESEPFIRGSSYLESEAFIRGSSQYRQPVTCGR